ncbi:TPR domain-containing protein [alpha proteobacterium U9-1i]|nr:TPR domain-containing protein [alpha proteobacterium U9-1i]
MLTRRALAGLVAIGAASAAAAQAQSARRAEVQALRRFAETTHPRGREAAADADWRARWDALARDADALSIGAYFVRTRRALGWFKDGHTTVLPFEFTGGPPEGPFRVGIPIRARAFHDGLYINAAKEEGAPLTNTRITRIGEMSDVDFMRAVAEQWPGNDAWAHRWAGWHISSPALLEGLGAIRDINAPIVVEAMRGRRRVRAALRPRLLARNDLVERDRTPSRREMWEREAAVGNYVRMEGRAIFISCNAMDELEPFMAFTRQCFAAMENADADRLIFDVRRNGGGNNFLPEALRKRILRSRFNRPGGLYVLTSPFTFSAAQNPSTRLERDSFAIFVGEPTGGAPNHYGDAQPFVGEASGLTAIVSTLPWFDSYPQDTRPWILPDLPAPVTFAEAHGGADRALEIALTHTTDAEADELSRERVFFYERPSQTMDWLPFWRAAQ